MGDDNGNDIVSSYPSYMDLPNVIVVTAITNQGTKVSFSSYRATMVDLPLAKACG